MAKHRKDRPAVMRTSFQISRVKREQVRWLADGLGIGQGEVVELGADLLMRAIQLCHERRKANESRVRFELTKTQEALLKVASSATHGRDEFKHVAEALNEYATTVLDHSTPTRQEIDETLSHCSSFLSAEKMFNDREEW